MGDDVLKVWRNRREIHLRSRQGALNISFAVVSQQVQPCAAGAWSFLLDRRCLFYCLRTDFSVHHQLSRKESGLLHKEPHKGKSESPAHIARKGQREQKGGNIYLKLPESQLNLAQHHDIAKVVGLFDQLMIRLNYNPKKKSKH